MIIFITFCLSFDIIVRSYEYLCLWCILYLSRLHEEYIETHTHSGINKITTHKLTIINITNPISICKTIESKGRVASEM
jgi:hypothetical protein